MLKALAKLHALIARNLPYVSSASLEVEPASMLWMTRLLAELTPHIFCLTQAVASEDQAQVLMLDERLSLEEQLADFRDEYINVRIVPGSYDLHAFAEKLAHAFVQFAADVQLAARPLERRHPWLARWLAASALSAHIALTGQLVQGFKVRLRAEPKEGPMSLEGALPRVLAAIPGEQLLQLPLHRIHCVQEAAQASLSLLRKAIALSESAPQAAMRRNALATSSGLAFFFASQDIRHRPAGNLSEARLHLKAREDAITPLLLRHAIASNETEAERIRQQLVGADEIASNHAAVRAHRGKVIFSTELARAWQAVGLLNARIFTAYMPATRSREQVVRALIKDQLISALEGLELLEACAQLSPKTIVRPGARNSDAL